MVEKTMKKPSIIYLVGIVLFVCGVGLFVFDKIQTNSMDKYTQMVVEQIQDVLPTRTQAIVGQYTNVSMPVFEVEDVDYCGLLEIERMNVLLPIADVWDSKKVLSRYDGSVYDGTMVVGGVGLEVVTQLDLNDRIHVVDMLGGEFTYSISRIDRVSDMNSFESSSSLVLFCYISSEGKYVVVSCK